MTQELVRELFDYKADTGELVWKEDQGRNKTKGKVAGCMSRGYCIIGYGGQTRFAHRFIFLWHHGYLPKEIDHINGISSDNRIENLRAATRANNQYNRKGVVATSVWKGVSWCKKHNKWRAVIVVNRKCIHLGYSAFEEDAAMLYNGAALIHHKEFARLNNHKLNHAEEQA